MVQESWDLKPPSLLPSNSITSLHHASPLPPLILDPAEIIFLSAMPFRAKREIQSKVNNREIRRKDCG